MDGSVDKRLMALVFGLGTLALAGCGALDWAQTSVVRLFHRDFSDTVPGISSPAERIGVLRKTYRGKITPFFYAVIDGRIVESRKIEDIVRAIGEI